MPQGGGSTSASSNQVKTEGAGKEIFRLVREGISWSGHEPNTCFLSSGESGRFLDISKSSGFAFPDDGRAMILTDWDGDGDLDSFISNRNAPQIRFLRNDIPDAGRNWLSIRLTGSGIVNRDAIGARVTLIMNGQPPISRSLRAGDGFQAQASKQLHFGLGSEASIKSLQVRWPNGELSEYDGLAVDNVYTITYGEDAIKRVTPHQNVWPVPIPELEKKNPISGASARLNSKLTAPTLSYTDFSGQKKSIDMTKNEGPVLINLWASWCLPCLVELKDFNDNKEAIEKAGLKIFALSVDGIDGQEGNPEKALELKNRMAPYFETGMVSEEFLTKVRILHDTLFEKRGNLVVPTSILIDADGKVMGFYEGKISSDRILRWLSDSEDVDNRWRSLPFPGRWLAEPLEFRYSEYGNQLLDYDFRDDAVKLYESKRWSERGHRVERFLSRLATSFEKSKNPQKALHYFSLVADLRSKDVLAQVEIANKYSAAGDVVNAAKFYARALRLDPSDVNTRYNLGVMFNRLGKPENAITEFEQVLERDPKHTMALANSAAYYIHRKNPHSAIVYLERTLATKPDFHQARFQLARLYEAVGDTKKAIKHYKALLVAEPKHQEAAERLAPLMEKQN